MLHINLIVDVSEEAQPIEAETNLIRGSELNWDLTNFKWRCI